MARDKQTVFSRSLVSGFEYKNWSGLSFVWELAW